MAIDKIRYFAAVVETGNLRKAAELVGIAAASMSKAISSLESELGHKLIYPEGRGIGITPKGLEIYQMSSSLLDEHRRFYERLQASENHTTRVRMATFEVFSTYFMSTFLSQEPNLELMLLEMTPGHIEQSILAGTVDFGLTYLPCPDPILEYKEVGSFQMGLFGNKIWETKPFSEWPFAIPATELRINSSEFEALDMWPRKSPRRKIKYQFELLETALQTAHQGLSVIHCPDFIVALHNLQVKANLQLIPLSSPAGHRPAKPVKVFLVSRKGVGDSVLERKFAKFMRSF